MNRYAAYLSVLLILVFQVKTIWPQLIPTLLTQRVVTILVTAIVLVLYFRENRPTTFKQSVKKGMLLGAYAGLVLATFFFLYTTLVDTNYFYDVAALEIEKLDQRGYPQSYLNRAANTFGMMRKYHVFEMTMLISTFTQATFLSMIIAPLFNNTSTLTVTKHEA